MHGTKACDWLGPVRAHWNELPPVLLKVKCADRESTAVSAVSMAVSGGRESIVQLRTAGTPSMNDPFLARTRNVCGPSPSPL